MPPKARKYRLSGWRRLPEEQSEDRSEAHGIDRLAPAERELYSLSLAAFLQARSRARASRAHGSRSTVGSRSVRSSRARRKNSIRSRRSVSMCGPRSAGASVATT